MEINNGLETVEEGISLTDPLPPMADNVQVLTNPENYIPIHTPSSLYLYESLKKEVNSMPPFKQRDLYERASYKLEDARYQKLREDDRLLFDSLFSNRDRPLTHEELGSIKNPFVRIPTGIAEAISGKYYQEKENLLFMKELFTNKHVLNGEKDNVFNVDLVTAIKLDRYRRMSAQYSDTANLGGIEEAVYGFAETLEQWGIPIGLGVAGIAASILSGGTVVPAILGAASSGYLFTNTFAQEAGSRKHLLYNKDIPTDIAFNNLISIGMFNAGIEMLSFGLVAKTAKAGALSLGKKAASSVSEEAIEKNIISSFKEKVISQIKDRTPYLVKPLKFTKGYLSFTTPEIAQELGQDAIATFFESSAINWKDPLLSNPLEDAIESAIESAPQTAKSLSLLYLLPFAGSSALSGANRILKHRADEKLVAKKEQLDKVLQTISKETDPVDLRTSVNTILGNTAVREIYISPEKLDAGGIEGITEEELIKLKNTIGVDDAKLDYYKRINKPIPVDVGSYAMVGVDQQLNGYIGSFSLSKNGKNQLDIDVNRVFLEEVATKLRTDSMQFKKEFNDLKKKLVRDKTITFNKTISKGKDFKFIKEMAIDILTLFHYSFKTRGGVKTPNIKIHLMKSSEDLAGLTKDGDVVPKTGMGIASVNDKGTNVYINLSDILEGKGNMYQSGILRTLFHEIGHSFYNNETFWGEANPEFLAVRKELEEIMKNKDFLQSIKDQSFGEQGFEDFSKAYLTRVTEAFARVFETQLLYDVLANRDYTANIFGKYKNFINDDAKLLDSFFKEAYYYDNQLLKNTKIEKVIRDYIIPKTIKDFYVANKIYTVFTDEAINKLIKDGRMTENDANGLRAIIESMEKKTTDEVSKSILERYRQYDNKIIKQEELALERKLINDIKDSPMYNAMTYISGNTYRLNTKTGRNIIKNSHKLDSQSLNSYLLEAGIDIETFRNLNSNFIAKKNGYNIKEVAEAFGVEPLALLKYIELYSKDPFYGARLFARKKVMDKYKIKNISETDLYTSETSMNLNSKIFIDSFFSDNIRESIIKEIEILSSLDENINVSNIPSKYKVYNQMDAVFETFPISKISDIIDYNSYMESFTESSAKARQAFENNDYARAINYKIKQYGSYIYYSKSLLLQNRIDALNTFAKDMYEHSSEFQSKYGAATYMFINKILMNIGFVPPESNKIHKYINDPAFRNLTYKEFFEKHFEGYSPIENAISDEKMKNITKYGQLSVNDFLDILNNIEAAKVVGATKEKHIIDKRNEKVVQIKEQIEDALIDLKDKDKPKGRILKSLKSGFASATKFSTIIKIITRDDPNHFLYKLLLNRELDCNSRYAVLSQQYEKAILGKLLELAEINNVPLQKYLQGRRTVKISDIEKFRENLLSQQAVGKTQREVIERFFEDEVSFTIEEMLMIALNAGNQHNLDLLASKNKITQEVVDAVRDALTVEELDAVQAIHDSFEVMASNSFDEQQKINSIRPVGVAGKTYEAKGKTYKGGYYPILTQSLETETQAVEYDNKTKDIKELEEKVSQNVLTYHGFLKARGDAEYSNRGLQLDKGFDKLFWFTDHVAKDTAWRRYLMDVKNTFLGNPKIEDLLNYKIGPFTTRIIERHLNAIAGISYRKDALSIISKWLRAGSQLSTLGFSIATSAIQLGGVVPSVSKIGLSYVSRGLANFRNTEYSKIIEKDVFMQQRKGNYTRDYKDITASWRKALKTKFNQQAFWLIRNIDYAVSRITYIGAYEQYMDKFWIEGKSTEEDAMKYAANVVIETQGSGLDFTLSSLEAETNPLYRLFTMYMTFNNAALNAILLATNKTKDNRISASKFKAYSMYFILLPAISMMLRGSWLYLIDSDDENDKIAYKKMRGEVVGNMFGIIPLIGSAVYSIVTMTPSSYLVIDNLVNDFQRLSRFVLGNKSTMSTEKFIDVLAKSTSILGNVPLQRPVQYTQAIERYVRDADYTFIDMLNKMLNNHTKKQK